MGRESRALPLTDNTVSRRHCELKPHEGTWAIYDMGSANGTYVNGVRVRDPQMLKLGDQIRIGRTLMVFGAQPGVSRTRGDSVTLAGEESGMDSAIMHTVAPNEDSMVLAVPEPTQNAMANLQVLYQLSAALGSSFDIDQAMEVVMDLVFEHVKADRGMILLAGSDGALTPAVVRTRDEVHGRAPGREPGAAPGAKPEGARDAQITASRTIIDHVVSTGQGVLSSNAMADRRFSKGKSVHHLGIRSAMCVPIKARRLTDKGGDEVVGVIYIDSSVRNYTYSPEQLRLLTAIGLQAGMALQNAKLYQAGIAAERMAAIGETTAALSHSIKNILQALRGGADVVEMGFRNNNQPQAQKGWGIVSRNLEKIFSLTLNLLSYSRERKPDLQFVQPRKVIEECLELIAPVAAERGIMAVADVEPEMPPVPMDPDGMHQVLMNLLSNAVDALPADGGLIKISARLDMESNQCVIEVSDNGHGVPPPMMKHMFELFHSTKGNKGTGLGLAVSKKIVEEHDGTISVSSTPGEGTTFRIRLPLFSAALGDSSGTAGPSQGQSH